MDEEVLLIHFICDDVELEESTVQAEELLRKVDAQSAATQHQLELIANEAERVEAKIQQQYVSMVGTIHAAFTIYRNVLNIFGASMTLVEQAVLTALETTLTAISSMQAAILRYHAGMPMASLAKEALNLTLTVSASAMLVAAQATARRQFREVQSRLQSASNILDISSRSL